MDMFDNKSASPMLIAHQTKPFNDYNYIYELKLDGFRCVSYIDKHYVDLRNKRNLKVLSKFPELSEIYRNVKNRCILDGEIIVLKDGVPDFYQLQKRTLLTDRFKIETEAKLYPASYVIFDCLYVGDEEIVWEPLMKRKQIMNTFISESDSLATSRYIEYNGIGLYQATDEAKLEGVVAKRKDSMYIMGKRSKDWVKFKRMSDEDFIVAGFIPKSKNTFTLVLGKYKGDSLIPKGYVTSGVTQEVVKRLNIIEKCPFSFSPISKDNVIWVKPNYVCVVEYMPNLNDSLRQPVFKGFRTDVMPKNVTI